MPKDAGNGQRWITIGKEGPLQGRRLLIDGAGTIVGGGVPKTMQGRNIKDLHKIGLFAKQAKDAEKPAAATTEKPEAGEKPAGGDVGGEAYDKLKKTYPENTLGWAKNAKWSKQEGVSLKDIDMARRPGGRDMGKVNGIADAVKGGKSMDPVHLVRTPGDGKLKIADGYHRTLGHLKAGHDKVSAYVADVDDEKGPWDKEMHDSKLNLSDAEKAKKAEQAPEDAPTAPEQAPEQEPDKAGQPATEPAPEVAPKADEGGKAPDEAGQEPQGKPDNVQRKGNRLDDLHDDVKGYMDGKGDAGEILKKHDRLIQAMARNVAEKRGGEAEDLAQEGRTAAFKTLEALKNGTQKPKEGQHLGEHMLRRVKQGLSEGARQSNERPMSRESSKLAALVNSHKTAHANETGQDPSEDELFDRVSKDDGFNKAKFAAPGTKKSIEDPREKFNSLRDAMKNQKSQPTLDEQKTDDEGSSTGTKGSSLADPKGSAEDQAMANEDEKDVQERRDKLHGVLGELGLSASERFAVAHRFGVGHKDATGAVLPWDKVSEHMSKDLGGKKVNPETAKKHFNNGRAKLHQHIGDDRMSMLMEKSMLADAGIHLLRKMLYELGVYDILKSHGLESADVLEPVPFRTLAAVDYSELVKSIAVNEYIDSYKLHADGHLFAHTIKYAVRG